MSAALQRLRKRSEFLAVAAANRRSTTPGLVLQVRPRTNDTIPVESITPLRIGFTATKKVGNAVKRNRARRRLRAAVRDVLRDRAAIPADIVLIARQATLDRDFQALKTDLETALRRFEIVG